MNNDVTGACFNQPGKAFIDGRIGDLKERGDDSNPILELLK